mmetsp:Transcript_11251/g.31800  ORF Transcript_11251/g.31800 Transcript_11251/m.31800 type:complete len:244 (+) Transcript_11251:1709-2440(+)
MLVALQRVIIFSQISVEPLPVFCIGRLDGATLDQLLPLLLLGPPGRNHRPLEVLVVNRGTSPLPTNADRPAFQGARGMEPFRRQVHHLPRLLHTGLGALRHVGSAQQIIATVDLWPDDGLGSTGGQQEPKARTGHLAQPRGVVKMKRMRGTLLHGRKDLESDLLIVIVFCCRAARPCLMSPQWRRDIVIGLEGIEKGWILGIVRKEEQIILHLPSSRRLWGLSITSCKPLLHGRDQRRRACRA